MSTKPQIFSSIASVYSFAQHTISIQSVMTSTFLPKFYMSEKKEIWYIVAAGVSREKLLLLSRHVSVKNGQMNWKHFSFYRHWDSGGSERIKAAGTGL